MCFGTAQVLPITSTMSFSLPGSSRDTGSEGRHVRVWRLLWIYSACRALETHSPQNGYRGLSLRLYSVCVVMNRSGFCVSGNSIYSRISIWDGRYCDPNYLVLIIDVYIDQHHD